MTLESLFNENFASKIFISIYFTTNFLLVLRPSGVVAWAM